jgi:hypothetical protein
MTIQLLSLLPALKIHSWGGFGSQLFTAHVILKIKQELPGRRIKVVIHTSGVTRRFTEFDFETLGVKVIEIDDHKSIKVQNGEEKYFYYYLLHVSNIAKKVILWVLDLLRIVQRADDDNSLNLLSFWTLALRGHYTRLTLEKPLIESLYHVLFPGKSECETQKNDLVVHYRLGDLLVLSEKQPIRLERVESVIHRLMIDSHPPVLLSDSRDEELAKFFKSSKLLKNSETSNYSPIQTLRICVNAEKFIGTAAKLSLWAAVFRDLVHGKESFLPAELNWVGVNGLKANWY